MKKVIATGKTIEEATQVALNKLGVSREQVEIQVLIQPSRGLFGLIGSRDAEVEVVVKEQFASQPVADLPGTSGQLPASPPVSDTVPEAEHDLQDTLETAKDFLESVIQSMGLKASVTVQEDKEGFFLFKIEGEKMGILIGRRGQTLDSLQYLVNLVANKNSSKFMRIVLDAEDYRARRRETLERLADKLARQVIRERRDADLEPMPAPERKVIHTYLQGHPKVGTRSEGTEPNRRVVIYYKK